MSRHLRPKPTRHSLTLLRRNGRRLARRRRVVAGLLTLVAAAFALTGCGTVAKYVEPYNDAPRGREWKDKADIIVMPDGYGNAATKCGPGGMRFTTLFHHDGPYGSVSVVPDPSCPK